MEAKDVTRKRLGRSPDLGDALALSCVADLSEDVYLCGTPTPSGLWSPQERGFAAPSRGRDPSSYGRMPDGWRRPG
jgi:hypothetical protein